MAPRVSRYRLAISCLTVHNGDPFLLCRPNATLLDFDAAVLLPRELMEDVGVVAGGWVTLQHCGGSQVNVGDVLVVSFRGVRRARRFKVIAGP